jgi:adenosylcobinamide-phosphate synthase
VSRRRAALTAASKGAASRDRAVLERAAFERAAARRRAAARAVTGRVVADAAGMALGYALDAALGDPRRFHPVAGYGKLAAALERRTYADDRAAGLRHVGIAVGVPVALAGAAAFATRRRPVLRALVTAALTWTVLGGTSLRREARAMSTSLADGDLAAARRRLPHLAGRDPSTLDSSELARATVESVAENTSDAVVGPLVWGAVGGLPGLVGYRAVNTLDAMVGHRSPRYARFGTDRRRLARPYRLGVAARRQPPPEPQLRPVRGGRGGRARGPARRPQRLLRTDRGAAPAR